MKNKITVSLTWRDRKNNKFCARYFLNSFWAIDNTAEWFANGIDEPDKNWYKVVRKGGKIVCREAIYKGV